MFGKKLRNGICIQEEIASSLIWRNYFYHSGQYLCVLSEKERSEIHNSYFLCCFLRVSKLFYRTGGRLQRKILDEAGESN
jgi:hypothetical protein